LFVAPHIQRIRYLRHGEVAGLTGLALFVLAIIGQALSGMYLPSTKDAEPCEADTLSIGRQDVSHNIVLMFVSHE